jgi:hypothetical protein
LELKFFAASWEAVITYQLKADALVARVIDKVWDKVWELG